MLGDLLADDDDGRGGPVDADGHLPHVAGAQGPEPMAMELVRRER